MGHMDVQWNRKELIYQSPGSGAKTYKVPAVIDGHEALVACKVRPAKTSIQSLSRESHLLDIVKAPTIVEKIDYDSVADRLYLRYLQGETIGAYLCRADRSLPRDLMIARDMAEALAHVHSDIGKPAVVHNDISRGNYMVTDDGVRLLDFAGSYLLEKIPIKFRGTLIHSGRYTAPEKLEGRLDLGRESDVYDLGSIAFDLLSPYAGFMHESGRGEIPLPLEQALLRAIQPDYRVRPSAAELADLCNKALRQVSG